MAGKGIKLASVLGILMALFLAEDTEAKSAKGPTTQETYTTKQAVVREGEVGGSAGSRLEEAQAQPDVAAPRTREIDRKTEDPSGEPNAQRETAGESGLLGGNGARSDKAVRGPEARVLAKARESQRFHRGSRRGSKEARRQPDQNNEEYGQPQEEPRTRAEEPRQREPGLEVFFGGSGPKNDQMEARVAQLMAADLTGLLERPPASGGDPGFRERELEIARKDIVAYPVKPIPYERYVQLYKASAKRYGFANDWYVLAAVGKVESNHGENMGPSSAGAMGPMQFLPSTWKQYGVDGNKDGIANIMDPEDAIPAAAAYLRAGGAPNDWYAALYAYNHARWYVRQVLGIAEGYRRLAKDREVEPYV